ncbi:MAG: GDSL-type esterase/lipase family protein [Dokdonella sp.]
MRLRIALAVAFLFTGAGLSSASPLSVMPLGDSLTEGLCSDGTNSNAPASTCYEPYYEPANADIYNHYDTRAAFCGEFARQMVENYNHGATGGFRGPLLSRLVAAGISTTFVGHVQSGTALGSPPLALANADHEGHGNWLVEQLAYCAGGYPAHSGMPSYIGYVAAQHPDVVLLQIGSNNVLNGAAANSVADGILALQATIERVVPRPRLLIALFPLRFDFSVSPARPFPAFETVRNEVARRVAMGSGKDYPCTARDIPDMGVLEAADFTAAEASGGLHPNSTGYAKMADIWAAALTTPECRFDTRSFVTLGGVLIESISAYGRYWNFDTRTGSLFESGALNTPAIPRYKSICAGHPLCTFDTRTFIGTGDGAVESITAFNDYHDFSVDGQPIRSGTLRSVPRYNQHVCSLSANPATCVFDTRAIQERNGRAIETITAYGRYFDFDQASAQ